eukprot:Hpha_TRINITY_DN1783_c0_g1::TRINITY_DN1783_c0_g1_i1::g.158388::m.158388
MSLRLTRPPVPVSTWLQAHGLAEHVESLTEEGFDDLEDLAGLAMDDSREGRQSFLLLVPKEGHRRKLFRLLQQAKYIPNDTSYHELQPPLCSPDSTAWRSSDSSGHSGRGIGAAAGGALACPATLSRASFQTTLRESLGYTDTVRGSGEVGPIRDLRGSGEAAALREIQRRSLRATSLPSSGLPSPQNMERGIRVLDLLGNRPIEAANRAPAQAPPPAPCALALPPPRLRLGSPRSRACDAALPPSPFPVDKMLCSPTLSALAISPETAPEPHPAAAGGRDSVASSIALPSAAPLGMGTLPLAAAAPLVSPRGSLPAGSAGAPASPARERVLFSPSPVLAAEDREFAARWPADRSVEASSRMSPLPRVPAKQHKMYRQKPGDLVVTPARKTTSSTLLPHHGHYKVIVVGDANAGKTSFINRLVEPGRFNINTRATLGMEFSRWATNVGGRRVQLSFYDIGGQERFSGVTRAFYQGAHAALICFDRNDPHGLQGVAKWKQDIDKKVILGGNDDGLVVPCILLANKCDLPDRSGGAKALESARTELRFVGVFETSAKANHNVRSASDFLVQAILKNADGQFDRRETRSIRLSEVSGGGQGCRVKPCSC